MRTDIIKRIIFDSYKGFQQSSFTYDLNFDCSFNLIIGRNNSGKSSLIDIIQTSIWLCIEEVNRHIEFDVEIDNLCISFVVDEEHIKRVFKTDAYFNNTSYLQYALQYIGDEVKFRLNSKTHEFIGVFSKGKILNDSNYTLQQNNWWALAYEYLKDIRNLGFRRVNAERDIVPEYESDIEDVDSNGEGMTNLVRKYINKENLDELIVEETLLEELNYIIGDDAHYTGIRVQQIGNKDSNGYKWEIYLEENRKRYALSKSGSGLKTILLVLVNLYLIPKTKKYLGKEIVYAFEELENNLHPALQRRLYEYLYDYSVKHSIKMFLTSHSTTAINTFYRKNDARILHVSRYDNKSFYSEIKCGEQVQDLLDDLGIKAGDLFQANGVIWVEGPSDRIYINRWLELFCNNTFVEGRDYQYMYYGGRLLSHYTASQYDEKYDEDLISMLSINRHSAIVIDSDKKSEYARINITKQRIRNEMIKNNGFCWITKGKEIENYISAEAINSMLGTKLNQINQYDLFPDYIRKYKKDFSTLKVNFARNICSYITEDNSDNILDLRQQVTKLYAEISSWCSSANLRKQVKESMS